MTLSPTRERATDERTRGAWATYALTLEGLEGREYEHAEEQAWDTLQRELSRIAASGPGSGFRPGPSGRV